MLQEQNAAQTRDMEHLQSRNGDLTHRYTEADMRCGELAADLVTANTAIEQYRPLPSRMSSGSARLTGFAVLNRPCSLNERTYLSRASE